jgi:hypothetical protein
MLTAVLKNSHDAAVLKNSQDAVVLTALKAVQDAVLTALKAVQDAKKKSPPQRPSTKTYSYHPCSELLIHAFILSKISRMTKPFGVFDDIFIYIQYPKWWKELL